MVSFSCSNVQGRFEILSLSGSYTSGGTGGGAHRKSLIMSVSLAKPDGRVFGGGVEGPLVAAGLIQVRFVYKQSGICIKLLSIEWFESIFRGLF